MKDRSADDWEELARREPYFAVLTDEGFLGVEGNAVATAEFFRTGEEDVASLLDAVGSMLGRELSLGNALDYGCGVGRLTIPLARRATRVTGCDVAPTMLALAAQNSAQAGLDNTTFVAASALAALTPSSFDFVVSLLVFQHIPRAAGTAILRTLFSLLAPGGVAAIHVTFERPGGALRRLARTLRARSRLVHRAVSAIRRDARRLPYMQMNEYDERTIRRDVQAAGARLAGRFPTRHGDTSGAVLVIEKPR
jgi:SAM-dependent methyltransferase